MLIFNYYRFPVREPHQGYNISDAFNGYTKALDLIDSITIRTKRNATSVTSCEIFGEHAFNSENAN